MCCDWQVAEELQSGPMSTEEKELLHLLMSPHLKVNTFNTRDSAVVLLDLHSHQTENSLLKQLASSGSCPTAFCAS